MKIACDELVAVQISMLYAQIILDGVLNYFSER